MFSKFVTVRESILTSWVCEKSKKLLSQFNNSNEINFLKNLNYINWQTLETWDFKNSCRHISIIYNIV